MAYGSLKRVIGETHLERKCRFLFGLCLLLLITGSFWWYGNQTNKLVYERNRQLGRLIVDTAWYGLHWREMEKDEDFVHVIDRWLEEYRLQDYSWRYIKPPTVDPESELSEHERQLLRKWTHPTEVPEAQELSQTPFYEWSSTTAQQYYYYQPIYAESFCVLCHRSLDTQVDLASEFQLEEGDLMAIIEVTISDEEVFAAQRRNRAILLATAIITVFLAMVALYVIVRYVIVKPLQHLRHVSDEISRGNTQLRADIHTGDEFEELGAAFNRMLHHLVDAQEELRTVNRNLDSKVDQLAQVNMRLYEMNRMKNDFLATVSHELRTPLNSIIGFSDVLSNIDALSDKQRRYATNIQQSGRMLLEMINDILDLAKIESGKMKIRLSEFSIESVIAAQCDMARPLTEKKNIDLEYEIEPGLPELVQDQAKVQQILNNLLSNAIKFTPEGGRITLIARRDDQDRLEVMVEDTGVGIAQEDQTTIFEKFRQGTTILSGGDAMTREYSGTGLGLSIVKELCRLLGGEVTLTSELGKGSTFFVRLPWRRSAQPLLESDLAGDLEGLTKSRLVDVTGPPEAPVIRSTPAS